ncbi:MAG: hypothetical protein KDB03_25490 [Planctomycetales bacterium]|nr:hypothetical protein [Planctomycetales bacterium]
MPFAPESTQIVAIADWNLFNQESRLSQSSIFESSRYELSEIVYGFAKYPLKRLLHATYMRAREEFLVEGLSPEVVGHGKSAEEASEDFCLKFHSIFQQLVFKRPFEMSPEESVIWNKVKDIVDVTVYRNRTPLVVEQYGVVSHGQRSVPCQIKWDNGFTEAVDVRQVENADYVRFVPGQPVKAIVRRNPMTRELIDIPYLQKVASLPSESDLVTSGFVEQVLNAEPFPDANWD